MLWTTRWHIKTPPNTRRCKLPPPLQDESCYWELDTGQGQPQSPDSQVSATQGITQPGFPLYSSHLTLKNSHRIPQAEKVRGVFVYETNFTEQLYSKVLQVKLLKKKTQREIMTLIIMTLIKSSQDKLSCDKCYKGKLWSHIKWYLLVWRLRNKFKEMRDQNLWNITYVIRNSALKGKKNRAVKYRELALTHK